jgi:guanidinopropionase
MTDQTYQPVDAAIVPRFAGPTTFMRLPSVASAAGLDIALVESLGRRYHQSRRGRHGPVKSAASPASRRYHVSGTEPFSWKVADVGDCQSIPST